ncbi:MAG: LytTR family transcriptional regulator [Oscillospiraceae bacterium]|nr:LytTR family transcriptional regulator [Oscillospiraceae bacterium]
MKKIEVRFERSDVSDRIEVVVRAAERDKEVEEVMARAAGHEPVMLNVTDSGGAQRVIRATDVLLISVNGKQVDVVTENGRYTARTSLQSMEEILDPALFLRISRFELVNLAKVARYDFTLDGTLRLEMAGGVETWASRRCIPAIRRRMKGKE